MLKDFESTGGKQGLRSRMIYGKAMKKTESIAVICILLMKCSRCIFATQVPSLRTPSREKVQHPLQLLPPQCTLSFDLGTPST
jgi:hypothetical protein